MRRFVSRQEHEPTRSEGSGYLQDEGRGVGEQGRPCGQGSNGERSAGGNRPGHACPTDCEGDPVERIGGRGAVRRSPRGLAGRSFIADAAEASSESEAQEDEGLSDLERDEAAAGEGFIDEGSQLSEGAGRAPRTIRHEQTIWHGPYAHKPYACTDHTPSSNA